MSEKLFSKEYNNYLFEYSQEGVFSIFLTDSDNRSLVKSESIDIKSKKDFEMEIIYQLEKLNEQTVDSYEYF